MLATIGNLAGYRPLQWRDIAHEGHDGCDCSSCRGALGEPPEPFSVWLPARSWEQADGEKALWKSLRAVLGDLKAGTYELVARSKRVTRAADDVLAWTPAEQFWLDRLVDKYMKATVGGKQPSWEDYQESGAVLPEAARTEYAVGLDATAQNLLNRGSQVEQLARSRAQRLFLRDCYARLSQRGWGALKDVLYREGDVEKWLANKADAKAPGVTAIIEHGVTAGRNPIAVARDCSRAYDDYLRWEFERLARTETAFALNSAAEEELINAGFARVAGTPGLPYHPNCRCTWTIDRERGYIVYNIAATACERCQGLRQIQAQGMH